MSQFFNTTTEALQRWTPANTNTSVPRAVIGDPNNNNQQSSRFIEDGSFLRLRNLTVGYMLPKSLTDRMKMSSVRLYVAGQNLFTVTKYKGYDPESAGASQSASFSFFASQNLSRGIDLGNYPLARTVMGGIQVNF
jgi:hypothetical protein